MKEISPALAALLRGEPPQMSGDAEWERWTREAQAEGVAPLAFWSASQAGTLSALPPSARNALRRAYFESWRRNQEIFQELEVLAREFQSAEIPFVLLKGACFALTLYPDVGVRPMGDLDILVPSIEWKGCVRRAKTLGYEEAFPEALPGWSDALAHEISLKKKGARAVLVEIHRSLLGSEAFRYAAPMDWFWEQTRPLGHPRFPGALIFSPAAQLLYASAHAMLQPHAKRAPLRWFADMDRLVRASIREADWDVLLRQAEMFGWSAALEAALQTARGIFETPIPPDVLQTLTERAKRSPLAETQPPPTRFQTELRKMSALNLNGKIRLLLALVFPSPAYMRRRYALRSPLWLPFYYPLRWLRALADGFRALWTLRKDSVAKAESKKLSKM